MTRSSNAAPLQHSEETMSSFSFISIIVESASLGGFGYGGWWGEMRVGVTNFLG